MLAYIPAELIASLLGGTHWWSLPAAVAVGVPAYLNGYAAIPTVSSLIDLGMAPGAGLGFILAGGVTSIPAAMAVFALVKHRVFAWYVALGLGRLPAHGLRRQPGPLALLEPCPVNRDYPVNPAFKRPAALRRVSGGRSTSAIWPRPRPARPVAISGPFRSGKRSGSIISIR